MSLGSFFTSTHFCRTASSSTHSSCFSSICFTHLCFNAPSQCTAVLDLRSAIYGLTPFRWLRPITLTPSIPLFIMGVLLLFMLYLFTPNFSGTRLGRKTGVCCREWWGRQLGGSEQSMQEGCFLSTDIVPCQEKNFLRLTAIILFWDQIFDLRRRGNVSTGVWGFGEYHVLSLLRERVDIMWC
jgi:hypothetical protein